MKKTTPDRSQPLSIYKRCFRVFMSLLRVVRFSIVFYLMIVLIGLIPVNNDFQPTPGGIEILFVSNAVHADIVLPINTESINWREHFPANCFSGDTSRATHVAIGWGDQGFYLETPTWADLRFSTAANALLWPSDTCLHISFYTADPQSDSARSVTISAAQYERLVQFINSSFRRDEDGSIIQIGNEAYGTNDAFFQAHGIYHCCNTCTCWVGKAMRSAGIRTGWFTPLPKTVFRYLPE